jgi:hypothetical protein
MTATGCSDYFEIVNKCRILKKFHGTHVTIFWNQISPIIELHPETFCTDLTRIFMPDASMRYPDAFLFREGTQVPLPRITSFIRSSISQQKRGIRDKDAGCEALGQ